MLDKTKTIAVFKIKQRTMFRQIGWIQNRFISRNKCLEAKIEVLMNYWDKIVGKLLIISADKKDENMKDMIKKFIVVSHVVKHACLGEFIK